MSGKRLPAGLPTVNWLLHGNLSVASSRTQGYLIHRALQRRGHRSVLLMAPPMVLQDIVFSDAEQQELAAAVREQIVVLQKVWGPRTESLIARLRDQDAYTIYVQCDDQPQNHVPALCDAMACPSPYLKERLERQYDRPVYRIDDPLESWVDADSITGEPKHPGRLRLAWIGSRHNWASLAPIRTLLAQLDDPDLELRTMSDHPDADEQWSLDAVPSFLADCDLGVIPAADDVQARCKSANRAALLMGHGLIPITSPLPAYVEIIEHGVNGLICRSIDDWRRAIQQVQNMDADQRREMARLAHQRAVERFSIERVLELWLSMFSERVRQSSPATVNRSALRRLRVMELLGYQRMALPASRWLAVSSAPTVVAAALRSPTTLPRALRAQAAGVRELSLQAWRLLRRDASAAAEPLRPPAASDGLRPDAPAAAKSGRPGRFSRLSQRLAHRCQLLLGTNPFPLRQRLCALAPKLLPPDQLIRHCLRRDTEGRRFFLLDGTRLYFEPDEPVQSDEALIESTRIVLDEAFLRPREMDHDRVQAQPGDTVLDLGGHIGTSAIRYSRTVGPSGRVFSFEPVSAAQLARNLAVNGISNVTLIRKGVSDRVGSTQIELCDNLIDSSIARRPGAGAGLAVRRLPIELTTIDQFVQEQSLDRVDLIKVDIEGAEELAIRGAAQTITRFRPRWTIASYHTDFAGELQHPKLVRQLRELGYELEEVHERGRGVRIFAW